MLPVAKETGLHGEAIRDVKLLERFSFLSVPAEDAERVVAAVDGATVKGIRLRVEPARVA